MQMTGQQRISAPRQQVWDNLNDPDILRRCIPGCQGLTKESDERLRAILEIKIGPIGVRLNGTVTLSDIDPQNSYSMTLEGQGGTVGFVKGAVKVRFAADDHGGTLLSYEVDAQIGGRLAQLGGPIIDSTARQLAAKFFQQLDSIIADPVDPNASPQPAVAGSSSPQTSQAASPAYPPLSRAPPVAWMLALVVAALVGYLIGHAQRGGGESDWLGLAIGLLLMIVAAAGFEFGRRAAAPVVVLDSALLARLINEAKR
jgi:carbon monoxide dehydrogenase subunit G